VGIKRVELYKKETQDEIHQIHKDYDRIVKLEERNDKYKEKKKENKIMY
jgi:hypothetical protein